MLSGDLIAMSTEELADLVLSVLSAADSPLSDEDIRLSMQPHPNVREVRIALRHLAEQREVLKNSSGRWLAITKPPEVRAHPRHDFSEAELQRARQVHGTTTSCPNCGKRGDIDRLFGWRRLHPENPDIQPQSWCVQCRQVGKS